MSNPFNISTIINVLARHSVRCPRCQKKNLIPKLSERQETVTCKHCGYKFTSKIGNP